MSDRAQWEHKPGDQYVVIATSVVGNDERFEFVHHVDRERYSSIRNAKQRGFALGRSVDFNIGALRGGVLVALLWMGEIVDDDPDEIAEQAQAVREAS